MVVRACRLLLTGGEPAFDLYLEYHRHGLSPSRELLTWLE
jgi:hypothetical protein